jgi:NTP pyrophosphatase (non-canonical NTP hydrolase)
MGKLWGRVRLWMRAPARCRELEERNHELEEQVGGLGRANELLVKVSFRDRRRIEALEKEAAVRNELACCEGSLSVPGLSPGEVERLAILAEECGEVSQAIGKVLRFGWESTSPYGGRPGRPNRGALEREIGNVRAIVNLMIDAGDLDLAELQSWQRTKRTGLAKWTIYQSISMPREEQLAMLRAIAASNREQ